MREAGARWRDLKVEADLDFFAEGDFHDVEVALLFRKADFGEEKGVGVGPRAKDARELVEGLGRHDVRIGELERAARLKDLYETRLKDVRSESNALELKNKEIEKRQCSGELKRKTAYEELRSKETLLRQYEDQLTTQLGECVTSPDDIERFDSVLEKLQEEHKANMDEKGFLNGVDKTYKRFLSQLQETTAAAGTL